MHSGWTTCKLLLEATGSMLLAAPGETISSISINPFSPDRPFSIFVEIKNSRACGFHIEFYTPQGSPKPFPYIDYAQAISPTAGGEECLKWVGDSIAHCETNHPCCQLPKQTLLPTRVIDVGSETQLPRLYISHGESGRFAALSHCWGKRKPLTPTRESLAKLQQAIPTEDLPPLFHDAVILARRLQIPYLWVDSLCIMQDDYEDWEREAVRMASVYSNAWVVFAAHTAKDSSESLLSAPRLPGTRSVAMECVGLEGVHGTIHVRYAGLGGCDSFDRTGGHNRWRHEERLPLDFKFFEPSLLANRGWVFQERILAKRTIHFTHWEAVWECGTEIRCECQRLTARLEALDSDIHLQWLQLVVRFTGLELTFDNDRLPAMAGLATSMQRLTSATYLQGLWSDDLPRGLLWASDSRRSRRCVNVPSWSWGSVTGRIQAVLYPTGDFLIEVIDFGLDTLIASPSYLANEAGIRLRGQIIDGRFAVIAPSSYTERVVGTNLSTFSYHDKSTGVRWLIEGRLQLDIEQVWNNWIKSFIFRAAEALLVLAIWKLFSLLAAVQNRFTSFAVFSESLIQKAYFVWCRGISRDALLVGFFTATYAVSQLYGTLLWAIDAPGYVVQTQRVRASSISSALLDDPEYIVSYKITPGSLNASGLELAEALSANLFRSGTNVTLTGRINQGTPQSVTYSGPRTDPRIWLDDEGWSVGTNTQSHVALRLGGSNVSDQFTCAYGDIEPDKFRFYNCTFDNEWALDMLQVPVGTPMVHYNREASVSGKVGMINPRRSDIWSSLGSASGTAVRVHMFTVTKGHHRHTFVSTAFKASIVILGDAWIPEDEIRDLNTRLTKPYMKPEEQELYDQGLSVIMKTINAAQSSNQSAVIGTVIKEGHQILEGFWELFTAEGIPGNVMLRVFRLTSVNITHLRSETIDKSPVPFEPCDNPGLQNVAVGGKVDETDCVGDAAFESTKNITGYLGQVDSSAVLHITGLGHAPYSSSAKAADPGLYPWMVQNLDNLTSLLLSRGYVLGLDPGLVTVELTSTTPGVSYLQVLMILFAAFLALVGWGSLWFFASGNWSSSILVNLLSTTHAVSSGNKDRDELGIVYEIPDIRLEKSHGAVELRTDTGVFRHEAAELASQAKSPLDLSLLGNDRPILV
ncbi:HET-domain-containing protein [Canariomyces notabilis]|uniref:HET-domain-containing protein n=1 Tax=Canariomyces notabilis TaxID=2074819 RepID=A0AAN6TFY9_9PEZI|nr:HET-domain-containing protein [Canariomyces arenarius]